MKEENELLTQFYEEKLKFYEFLNDLQSEGLKILRRVQADQAYDVNRAVQDLVDIIYTRLHFYFVSILVYDENSKELVLKFIAGDDTAVAAFYGIKIKPSEGISGIAFRTGKTVVENDVQKNPAYICGLSKTSGASEVAVPIILQGRVMGVLNIEDKAKNKFTPEVVSFLERVAYSVSVLIENSILHDEIKRRSTNLESDLREKEKEIGASQTKYKHLVENLKSPLLVIDETTRIIWANRTAREYFGLLSDSENGPYFVNFVKKGCLYKLNKVLLDISSGQSSVTSQLELQSGSGDERIANVSVFRISEEGRPLEIEFVIDDISEKIVLERLRKNYTKSLEEEVKNKVSEIKEVQRASILALATLAESIDNFTCGHLQRIRHYCKIISEQLRKLDKYKDIITEEYVEMLFDLSPLHDIGKVGIRESILQKQGQLTKDEFEIMKEHTVVGARALRMAGELVKKGSLFTMAELISRFHHQRWDGTGYPSVEINGEVRPLRGEEIPLCARIVTVADVYDALTSRRPYKDPYPHSVVKEMMFKDAGKHFDPEVVGIFFEAEEEILKVKQMFPDVAPEKAETDKRGFTYSERDQEIAKKL